MPARSMCVPMRMVVRMVVLVVRVDVVVRCSHARILASADYRGQSRGRSATRQGVRAAGSAWCSRRW
jgi:hypothetical protein